MGCGRDNVSTVGGMRGHHKTVAALGLALAIVLADITGCSREEGRKPSASLEKITFAVATQPISAPVYVAHAKGFFEHEGLDVSLQSFWTGKDALASVLKGTAQFGTVAETPIMFAGLKGDKFLVVATIADSNNYQKIVARKDRGMAGPQDMIGKRVGVSTGTTAEYFLDALLTYYRIPKDRIHIVPMKPEDLSDALAKGDIDAAVAWPPHLAKQQQMLGANAATIENEHIYTIYWNLVTGQEFAKAHPETVKKLLRALVRAERYMADNPGVVRALVVEKTGAVAFSLEDYHFDLQLTQSLLTALESQARWAIRKKLVANTEVPNFLPLIYTGGMEAVAPGSVTLIHE